MTSSIQTSTDDPTAADAFRQTSFRFPPAAMIPSPPAGFVAPSGSNNRPFVPRVAERAVITDAVTELKGATDFDETFGLTIPPRAFVVAILDCAEQWSSMRARLEALLEYCKVNEGMIWRDVRDLTADMKPVFEKFASHNPEKAAHYVSLARLLVTQKNIAARGAATRKANLEATARGEPAYHGKIGKIRANRDARALASKAPAEKARP